MISGTLEERSDRLRKSLLNLELSDDVNPILLNEINKDFRIPTYDEALDTLFRLKEFNWRSSLHLSDHFTKDLRLNCRNSIATLSPSELYNDKDLLRLELLYRSKSFERSGTLLRLTFTNKRCTLVGSFSPKFTYEVIKKYCFNGRYYDPSCGWGGRLTGASIAGVEYFGTDPNEELVPRLNQLSDFIHKYHDCPPHHIYCQGSEHFIQELEDSISLCFTSPPFFNLELYSDSDDDASTSHSSYNEWVLHFLAPTITNCYRYLVPGGYLGLCISETACPNVHKIISEICRRLHMDFICEEHPATAYASAIPDYTNSQKALIFQKHV